MQNLCLDKVTQFYTGSVAVITNFPLEYITAFSVVHQAMKDNPWIEQDILRNIVNGAISLAKNEYSQSSITLHLLLHHISLLS